MGKIMDLKDRTLANITDICFPNGKTRLTKISFTIKMKSSLNKKKICMFRLKGLTASQAKSERNLLLITSQQILNYQGDRMKNPSGFH